MAMKSPQRRSPSSSPLAALRSELERVRSALRELLGAGNQSLRPALVPIPADGFSRPSRELPPDPPGVHLAFGRKKDKSDDEEDDDPASLDQASDSSLDQLPPIPSALGSADLSQEGEEDGDPAPDAAGSWRPLDAADDSGAGVDGDGSGDDASPDQELPAWGSRPFSAAAFDSPDKAEPDAAGPAAAPWGVPPGDDETAAFSPAVVDHSQEQAESVSWLQSGTPVEPAAPEEAAPWSLAEDSSSAQGTDEPLAEAGIDDAEEIAPETPAEEVAVLEEEAASPEGVETETFTEILTVEEEPWTSPVAVVAESVVFQTTTAPAGQGSNVEVPSLETRSFPLPEGEVVFRNLRAGFTDPSRLLRHLAAEGHTGVLHVLGVDGSNNYVVLVDGYVVAVAVDRQGSITTTNRISFPNFPNSQDTINVISYSRQIARGLGLLLHAPVRFAGLGAMFVNLEGLRSYLSKYSSSGGLIVHAQDGIGVALFEDGKLLGAYANGNAPTSDLGQLRDLVKDLEAEIDVRFGGPQELEPTPLDTLLSGHPL